MMNKRARRFPVFLAEGEILPGVFSVLTPKRFGVRILKLRDFFSKLIPAS